MGGIGVSSAAIFAQNLWHGARSRSHYFVVSQPPSPISAAALPAAIPRPNFAIRRVVNSLSHHRGHGAFRWFAGGDGLVINSYTSSSQFHRRLGHRIISPAYAERIAVEFLRQRAAKVRWSSLSVHVVLPRDRKFPSLDCQAVADKIGFTPVCRRRGFL